MKKNNMRQKKELVVPAFKNEDAEREFWDAIDLSEYLDRGDAKPMLFPNLKPTSSSVSIRIPQHLLMRLKERANSLNIPYQSLMKLFLARGLSRKEW